MRKPTFQSDRSWDKSKMWVGSKPPVTPIPPASHLDREEWPRSTGSSPEGAGYKWPYCAPPSGSQRCSQSGRSLRAGCWSGPEGSHGVEPWAGCSRKLKNEVKWGDHTQVGRQTFFPARPAPFLLPQFLVLATARPTAISEGLSSWYWKWPISLIKPKERRGKNMKHWVPFVAGRQRWLCS